MSGTAFAMFSGLRVTVASLTIPIYGAWCADVVLAGDGDIATSGILTIGTLSLAGSVVRTSAYAGLRNARLVAGAGGWRKTIAGRAYANAGGVKLSVVLGDAAKEAGESVSVSADASIGTAFVREAAPAARVLRQLAGPIWWIDALGVTRIGPRNPVTPISSPFEILHANGGLGTYEIATEALGDWLPGRTFSGITVTTPKTIAALRVSVTNDGKGRVEALAA